jgi:hypothetical protein
VRGLSLAVAVRGGRSWRDASHEGEVGTPALGGGRGGSVCPPFPLGLAEVGGGGAFLVPPLHEGQRALDARHL